MGKHDDRLAFETLSEAVLRIASETELEPVLLKLVATARELVGARYAALGIPDGSGGFEKFLTSGMSDEMVDAIGPLPRTHGLLGAMLEGTRSYRTDDITADPRFQWWPKHHPKMGSFLGVPIVSRGRVLGAFYLTDKTPSFDDEDQRLIELFAAHAAIAIENARLFERSRELTVVEERNRLARDLHDSVVQTLFSLSLVAEAARHTGEEKDLAAVDDLAKSAMAELRSIVFELRPADLETEGLVATIVKHVEVELFRIVQEALSNALKHAGASEIEVVLDLGGDPARIEIADDGVGFDPSSAAIRARHLGLTSMEERARSVGGKLSIGSKPGSGTSVVVELPRG